MAAVELSIPCSTDFTIARTIAMAALSSDANTTKTTIVYVMWVLVPHHLG
jgi:hypothetical protein